MLCLSHSHGNSITPIDTSSILGTFLPSVRSTFTGSASRIKLEFRIATATRNLAVAVCFNGGETPERAAAAIVARVPPGFVGAAHVCPKGTGATNASYDVLINAANGERVTLIDLILSPGAGITVAVPRVDLMNVLAGDADVDNSLSFLTIEMKRIMRAVPVTDDAMYCVVVGQFSTPSLRGQAFVPCLGADLAYRPELPFRSSTIMAYTSAAGRYSTGGAACRSPRRTSLATPCVT